MSYKWVTKNNGDVVKEPVYSHTLLDDFKNVLEIDFGPVSTHYSFGNKNVSTTE